MTALDLLAEDIGVSGRTLRRAAARGLIRAERPSERKLALPADEAVYIRRQWRLLGALLEELRKQPNVRLAVLFGSLARGGQGPDSDLDLLVRLRRDTAERRAELVDALEAAGGRRVQLVSLAQAEEAPLLLADVVREGRVLVDRDRDWPRLQRRRGKIVQAALAEEQRLDELAWTAPEALEALLQGSTLGTR
jgi:predicted nucleotidyltransferase